LIKSATNTLVAWKPADYHGTTLPASKNPSLKGKVKGEIFQSGIAFVISNKLEKTLKKMQAEKLQDSIDEINTIIAQDYDGDDDDEEDTE
jgi:hypothetical protein